MSITSISLILTWIYMHSINENTFVLICCRICWFRIFFLLFWKKNCIFSSQWVFFAIIQLFYRMKLKIFFSSKVYITLKCVTYYFLHGNFKKICSACSIFYLILRKQMNDWKKDQHELNIFFQKQKIYLVYLEFSSSFRKICVRINNLLTFENKIIFIAKDFRYILT